MFIIGTDVGYHAQRGPDFQRLYCSTIFECGFRENPISRAHLKKVASLDHESVHKYRLISECNRARIGEYAGQDSVIPSCGADNKCMHTQLTLRQAQALLGYIALAVIISTCVQVPRASNVFDLRFIQSGTTESRPDRRMYANAGFA